MIADERVGVQVKLWNPLRTRAIPYLSASVVVIHDEEALLKCMDEPLPLPYQDDQQSRDGCIGTDFGFEVPGQSSNGL